MLIDTHAHLDFPDFADDLHAVVDRASETGVARIITIGTTVNGSRRAVELAEKFSNVFAAVGVHPTSAAEAPEDIASPLRELAKNPRVVAMGETGLDYHRLPGMRPLGVVSDPDVAALTGGAAREVEATIDEVYKETQRVVFEQQLELACELGLNVVIHQRDSWDDTLDVLKNYTGKLRAVFHCFGGTIEQAREVIALGHMVSFTGIVTFKNAAQVQQCAAQIPAESFMVETDCPFLAPVPFRGKRCEPAHTRIIAETIAKLRGISLEELAAQTTRNAEIFFRFKRG